MNGHDLDTLLNRALLDILSDRIVAVLNRRARSALVLFSETDLGLEAAISSLSALSASGWNLEIHTSAAASALVNERSLASLGGGALVGALARPQNCPLPTDGLLARHAVVIVPAMSVPLAARAALGLADDDISRLLSGALERGMRVVAARDGCCPACRERVTRGLTPSPAYRALMASHLTALESYGVEFAWASRLHQKVEDGRSNPSTAATSLHPAQMTGQVLGLSAVRALSGDELRLASDVLVTPLAAEELKARQIRLIRT